jgi:uncharacterized protein
VSGNAAPTPVTLVLPGLNGSGPEHWQTRWEVLHPGYRRVVQRDWDHPDCEAWLAALEAAVTGAGAPVVLVAHSLGCALAVHASARPFAASIAAALLVAPADVDAPERTPPETRGFAPLPLRPLPYPATVVASQDDPYVTLPRARAFAAAWGASFVDAGPRGHLNAASGLGDWPEGQSHLEALLARIQAPGP